METFSAFDLNRTQPLNQTIIRIPLRTEKQAEASKISQKRGSTEDIKTALEQFGAEIKDGGLLFLKHIRKVMIRVDNEVVIKAETIETSTKDTE